MHEIERQLQVIGFWGVLYLFYVCMCVFPSATTSLTAYLTSSFSLYVKAIICVGCALTRGRKERRTNANNGKNSNPELSKKSEIEGGNGQVYVIKKYERTTCQRSREIHVGSLPSIVGVRISLEKRPARKAHYSPSNLPEANANNGR